MSGAHIEMDNAKKEKKKKKKEMDNALVPFKKGQTGAPVWLSGLSV